MIRGKIPVVLPLPGRVVLVVRHVGALPHKIPDLLVEGIVPVAVEPHHLPDPLRHAGDQRLLYGRPFRRQRSRRIESRCSRSMRIPSAARRGVPGVSPGDLRHARLMRPGARRIRKGQCRGPVESRAGRLPVLHDHGVPALPLHCDRRVEEPPHRLLLRVSAEAHADPLHALHAERHRQIRRAQRGEKLPPAFDVAPLDLLARLRVPLPHEQREPLTRLRVRQHGEAGEIRPLMQFGDRVSFLGIRCQLCQFQSASRSSCSVSPPRPADV